MRAGTPPSRDQRHSHLTARLRADVLESENLFGSRLAHMQAVASVYAHPKCSLDQVGEKIRTAHLNALGSIPYMTGGKSGTEVVRDERQEFVNKWLREQEAMTKRE